jgi:hypothetical protein
MENKNIVSVVEPAKNNDFADIFVTEEDTFNVTLKYYKKDNIIYTDGGTDVDFSPKEPCKELVLTLKYPDQADCVTIASASPKMGQEIDKMDIRDFLSMELTRLIILMRKWSIDKKLDQNSIMSMHTKIVKGLLVRIREKIGMEGIV